MWCCSACHLRYVFTLVRHCAPEINPRSAKKQGAYSLEIARLVGSEEYETIVRILQLKARFFDPQISVNCTHPRQIYNTDRHHKIRWFSLAIQSPTIYKLFFILFALFAWLYAVSGPSRYVVAGLLAFADPCMCVIIIKKNLLT